MERFQLPRQEFCSVHGIEVLWKNEVVMAGHKVHLFSALNGLVCPRFLVFCETRDHFVLWLRGDRLDLEGVVYLIFALEATHFA